MCAGCNPYSRWHDDEFVIPGRFLTGSTSNVTIRLTATNNTQWTEFNYDAFGVPETVIPEPALVFVLGATASTIMVYRRR